VRQPGNRSAWGIATGGHLCLRGLRYTVLRSCNSETVCDIGHMKAFAGRDKVTPKLEWVWSPGELWKWFAF
jgi:hypothetical protein